LSRNTINNFHKILVVEIRQLIFEFDGQAVGELYACHH
jgi:hypothetical protein